MFVYNVKINGGKVFKMFFTIIVALIILIFGSSILRVLLPLYYGVLALSIVEC